MDITNAEDDNDRELIRQHNMNISQLASPLNWSQTYNINLDWALHSPFIADAIFRWVGYKIVTTCSVQGAAKRPIL